jgi:hypothetical protein
VADEDIGVLADAPSWTVTGPVATYRPVPDGWLARIRRTVVPGRAYEVWHVSLVDPRGIAQYTRTANLLGEARRMAEGLVRGQNR